MADVRPQRFEHLVYLEAGSASAPALILLHGGTMTAEWNWSEALPRLAEHFWIIAPDNAGHGRSANPRDALRYEDMAEDVIALCGSLGITRTAFYGFSDGAQIALELAIREPTLPTALVLSAVLHKLTPEYRAAVIEPGGSDGFAEPAWSNANPQLAAECRARHADWETLAAQVWDLWMRPLSLTAERLARVAAPVLLLSGDRDPFIPLERTVELLRLLPEAELAVIPQAAHDYDERFTKAALDFLLRVVAPARSEPEEGPPRPVSSRGDRDAGHAPAGS